MCVCLGGVSMFKYRDIFTGQKRVSGHLGLELQTVVIGLIWVLSIEFGTSGPKASLLTTELFLQPWNETSAKGHY